MAEHDAAQRKRELIDQGARLRAQIRHTRQQTRASITPGNVAESLLPQAVTLGLGMLRSQSGVTTLLANIDRLRPLLPLAASLLSTLRRSGKLQPALKSAATVIAAGGAIAIAAKSISMALARRRTHSERDSDFTLLR